MTTIWKIMLYVWQLPQNLLGLLFLLFLRDGRVLHTDDSYAVVRSSYRMRGGISLGRHVFISSYQCTSDTIRHELGHCRQSRTLGWLYLLVIGLPSLLWAALHEKVAPGRSYYWFYTERWADRLGGVER